MSLYDIVGIANMIGLALVLVFRNPFSRRPPRNHVLGAIGYVMMFVAAVCQLWLRFSA